MNEEKIEHFLVKKNITVVEALERLNDNGQGILFAVDEERHLLGCISDGDIRRWIIKTGNLQAEIHEFMNERPEVVFLEEKDSAIMKLDMIRLRAVPILDKEKRIVDVYIEEENNFSKYRKPSDELKNVPVVLMAGGKGTRLYPYTKILPKPLIPINDTPIAEHIINQFKSFGCEKFTMIVNYRKNMIKAYFNEIDKDYSLSYVDEEKPLGTGGGLSLLKGEINETFILSNCDILIQEDFTKIYKYHKEKKNLITMICSLKNYRIPYGVVHLGEDGTVDSMEEKPRVSFFTNTGCYIVEPEVLKEIPDDTEIGFPEIIEKYRTNGANVGVYPISEQSWLDMGQLDTLENMQKRLSEES